MNMRVGSKVKVVNIVRTTDTTIYERKKEYLGVEGIIYRISHGFNRSKMCGYPEKYDGQMTYTLKYSEKDISPFAWFAEELELIE